MIFTVRMNNFNDFGIQSIHNYSKITFINIINVMVLNNFQIKSTIDKFTL